MRLNNAAKSRRDFIEEGLSRTMAMQVRLNQVCLRCEQAMARHDLDDLLEPVVAITGQVMTEAREIHQVLQQIWDEGEERNWE